MNAFTVTNFGSSVGVLPLEKLNAEVGFDHKSGYGSLDDYPWYFNTKIGEFLLYNIEYFRHIVGAG